MFSGMDNVTVVDTPQDFEYKDMVFHVHPFTEDLAAFRSWSSSLTHVPGKINVMLIHQAVDGARLAGDVKSKGGLSLGDIRASDMDWVVMGHYHRPQTLAENTFYVGSPYEIDAGEAGDTKRLLRLSVQKHAHGLQSTMSSIPVLGMPSHKVYHGVESFKKSGASGDFNTIICGEHEEAVEFSAKGCKTIVREDEPFAGDSVSVGEVTMEEAVRLASAQKGRPALAAKICKRMGIYEHT